MKFVKWSSRQREDKQGYSKKIFLNEKELNAPWNLVQQVKVPAWQKAEIHYHKIQTEVFYFSDDIGYRIVNGETIYPKAWDVLVIQPNDKHTAVNETNKDYIYICFKINYATNDFYLD